MNRLRDCWSCGMSLDMDEPEERCPNCNAKDPCGREPKPEPVNPNLGYERGQKVYI
jgi:hypothetical protein